MPTKAKTHTLTPRNSPGVMRQEDHRPSAALRGYDRRWRRLRRMVLAREPLCRACRAMAPPRYTPSTQVDHIVPKSEGGPDTFANLQGLCATHHSQKTGRDRGES